MRRGEIVCVLCGQRRGACCSSLFFQAEDGIRDLVRSRGLGDVYKRQVQGLAALGAALALGAAAWGLHRGKRWAWWLALIAVSYTHLTLPTSDLV